jgi:hypothetical protein
VEKSHKLILKTLMRKMRKSPLIICGLCNLFLCLSHVLLNDFYKYIIVFAMYFSGKSMSI